MSCRRAETEEPQMDANARQCMQINTSHSRPFAVLNEAGEQPANRCRHSETIDEKQNH